MLILRHVVHISTALFQGLMLNCKEDRIYTLNNFCLCTSLYKILSSFFAHSCNTHVSFYINQQRDPRHNILSSVVMP